MRIGLELSQKQIPAPMIIQSMAILQYSRQELKEYIDKLALENPTIEISEDYQINGGGVIAQPDIVIEWLETNDYKNRYYYQQEYDRGQDYKNNISFSYSEDTLGDYLKDQIILMDISPEEYEIIFFLIESMDSNGFFIEDVSEMANLLSVDVQIIKKLLCLIQSLEPAGVGARNLKECLLLQIQRKSEKDSTAFLIINNYLDEVRKNHLGAIARKTGLSIEEVYRACERIKKLNPRPATGFADKNNVKYIEPDACVTYKNNCIEIEITGHFSSCFNINSYYRELFKQVDDENTKKYLQEKILQAEWVKTCLENRENTVDRVLKVITEKQKNFFINGPGNKQPLKLKDIAAELDLHESTVSRAIKEKYILCNWGTFPMKYFLEASFVCQYKENDIQHKGTKTVEQIKKEIKAIIDNEDKANPLSDQEIACILQDKGTPIARRTVNKYRSDMGIFDKNGRKTVL